MLHYNGREEVKKKKMKKNGLCNGSSIDGSVFNARYQEYSVSRTNRRDIRHRSLSSTSPSLSTDVSAKEGRFDPVHTD